MELDKLQAYLDRSLSPEEERELQARLKVEPKLAEALVLLAWEEASLQHWARLVHSADQACPEKKPWRPFRVRWSAAAAILLVAVGTWLWSLFLFETPAPHLLAPVVLPAAKVEHVEGEVYLISATGKMSAREKQDIFPDQQLQTGQDACSAVLSLGDTIHLEVSANTSIRFSKLQEKSTGKHQRIFLAEGLLTANVASLADRRLVVASPHAQVVILGTKFTFGSTQEAARIELEKGKVEFRRQKDGKTIEVGAGHYAVAAANDEPFVSQPLPLQQLEPRALLKDTHRSPVLCVAFSPNGKLIASGGRWLQIWDVAAEQARFTLRGHAHDIQAVAFSPDGKTLASASVDKTLKLWDPLGGQEMALLTGHGGRVNTVAFSPDGKILASGAGHWNEPGEIFLWDAVTGSRLGALPGHRQGVKALAFSPDGQYLASGSADNTIKIWPMAHWERERPESPVATLKGHRDGIGAVAFSRSGQWLASGGRFHDRTVKLWKVGTWKEQATFKAHLHAVHGVAFAPDDRWLASCSGDKTVIFWDLKLGKELVTLKAHANPVTGLAFAPDGTLATAGIWDRTIKLWDGPGMLLNPR